MTNSDTLWQRDGRNIEELPDPFTPPVFEPVPEGDSGKPPPSPRKRRWRYVAYGAAALLLVTLLWLIISAPLGRALEPLADPAMLLVSQEGVPIARRGAIKDSPVDVAKLNPLTPKAFIAIEDRRFRSHWGIDPRAIGRALMADLSAGGVRQGGSTITQQLAKTSFLSSDRSIKRKAQEVIIAFWLEAWLTKDEILSRYLSSVYFGDGVYGLRAASRHYFNRKPESLSLAQSAMLAGLVQAPSRLAPTHNLAGAQKRSRLVLQELAETRVISIERARATPSAVPVRQADKLPTGTYFADWVAPSAQKAFEAQYGEVRVATTLDANLQRIAVRAIANAQIGNAQAALVAMRPDGQVVAMVGGRSYQASPFNRATQAQRQPGSAFKLFVYLAAMRAGYSPDDLIEDKPVTVDGWTPANSDGVYRGAITLREAFARSSNAAAVRLSEKVGRANVLRAARELGITSPLPNAPSIALGTAGVSLLELTSAYAAVASGRYPVRGHGLAQPEVDNGIGGFFAARGGTLSQTRDWTPMLDLLWSAANEGTGRRAALGIPTFGKTGTTQNNRDALFVGFAGDLVVGVWIGRDDEQSLGKMTGGMAPAMVWHDFMASAVAVDHRRGPDLPFQPRRPSPPQLPDRQSPIPDSWSEPTQALRDIANAIDELIHQK